MLLFHEAMSLSNIFLIENSYLKVLMCNNVPCRKYRFHPINKMRGELGEFKVLYTDMRGDPKRFFEYMRMLPSTFDYIIHNIQEKISRKFTRFGDPISPEERLMVTLRYLSTGMSLRAVAQSFRMGKTTVVEIVKEVCEAIWKALHLTHMPIPSEQRLKETAHEFQTMWNFPNCIGCVDGKHIRMKCPKNSGSLFYNYKHFFSVILQGVADARYKFISIDVGAYGKQSDGGVFRASSIYKKIENGELCLPPAENLPGTNISSPHVLLGDDAYPLLPYLLKPFSHRALSLDEQIFNYRLSRARRVVECAFGIMSAKWRILNRPIDTSVSNAKKIIKCVTILHNLVIDLEGLTTGESQENCRQLGDPRNYRSRTNNSARNLAKLTREKFKNYFSSPEGRVPWQNDQLNH